MLFTVKSGFLPFQIFPCPSKRAMRSHICWINLRLERLGWRASFVCFRPLNIAALRSNALKAGPVHLSARYYLTLEDIG